MRIGIVGYGYVGKAMHGLFTKHHLVDVYDPALTYSCSKEKINECDLAVVCVPTPMHASGGCDTSIVEEVIGWLETSLILLKSTVPPGTTDKLIEKTGKNIVFSPEYCGESKYWSSHTFHQRVIDTPFFTFGGIREDTSKMVDIFMGIAGPEKKYRQTTAAAAEMAKYMANTFFATKITFCYEIAEICKAMGVDYNEARELWLMDPRINPMHTAVFAENDRPFGGKCLPKDLAALIDTAEENFYTAYLLHAVRASNDRIAKIRALKE